MSDTKTTQRRKALACLRCRSAKAACEGTPPQALATHKSREEVELRADAACPRCLRLSLECLWAPTKRTGRPPRSSKRQRVDEDDGEPEQSLDETHDTPTPASTSTGADANVASSSGTWSQFTGSELWQADAAGMPAQGMPQLPWSADSALLEHSGLSPFQDFQMPNAPLEPLDTAQLEEWMRESVVIAPELQPQTPSAAAESSLQAHPSPSGTLSPQAMQQLTALSDSLRIVRTPSPANFSSPRQLPYVSSVNPAEVDPVSELRQGVQEFFSRAAQWIPILDVADDWQGQIGSHSSYVHALVLQAAAALGLRLAGARQKAAAERALEAARHHAAQLVANPPVAPRHPCDAADSLVTLHSVQGLLLLATLEAGLGEKARASSCIASAARVAQEWGLHRLDAPLGFPGDANLPLASAGSRWIGDELQLQLIGGDGSLGGLPQHPAQSVLESLRRAWWEVRPIKLIFQ